VHVASSVRVVTPDWIIHCVEAMSRIDEIRYHPRLLFTVSQEFVHKASSMISPVHSLSDHSCQLDVSEHSSSVDVSGSYSYVRPCVTASEKSISTVPVSTVVLQQHVRTQLKNILNGNDYLTEACQSPMKSFGSAKVCIKLISISFLRWYIFH